VVPVDGLWVDDVWYYGGSPETVHVRTVRANPHVTMHLPDPWKVVVVQGEVRVSKPSPELAQRLADLANRKYTEYGIEFEASSYAEPGALHPRRVIAWSSFPKDATRFSFAE
jgi:Pyridoxamine 5'-phosphate oxidase